MADIIRVFPRKTKWTPDDKRCFFDGPPLFDVGDVSVYVSVVFTWDRPRAEYLRRLWQARYKYVPIGGPAYGAPGEEFVPGRFIKHGYTITSRGCPKQCPWCLASRREGGLRELPIVPGHNIADNNLLACSRQHIEAVFAMLAEQKKAAVFSGGLDIDYLNPWHVDRLKAMRLKNLFVACDTQARLKRLDKAKDLLADLSIEKKRCYVLIGFNGESLRDAEARCEAVYAKGFLPFAQLYRDDTGTVTHDAAWKALARKWSRPAAYRKRKD
jgi:hypothetical protein